MSGPQLDNIIKQFGELDPDGSGGITIEELKFVLQKLAPGKWTDEKIAQLVPVIDKNKDGIIQFEEFVAWAFNSFQESDFRKELGLKKPKVLWKHFELTISDEGVAKTFEKVHPSHKMYMLFERIAIQFLLPPSEIILCWNKSHASYGALGNDTCDDYGWAEYCTKDAQIPYMYVKSNPCIDAKISALQKERDRIDNELCSSIWFGKKINALQRRAKRLDDQPGFECKIMLIQKGKSKVPKWGEETVEEEYPQVVFYVGDASKPTTVYGKQVFPLLGEHPKPEKGFSDQWFNRPVVSGILETPEVLEELDKLRHEAKAIAGDLKQEANVNNPAEIEMADKKMQESYQRVELHKFTKEEKEVIQECVVPFLTRIFMKIYKPPDVVDDGKYVSHLKVDGFEIGPPKPMDAPKGSRDKYWTNSILGVSDTLRLRMFKALGLLEHDATTEPLEE